MEVIVCLIKNNYQKAVIVIMSIKPTYNAIASTFRSDDLSVTPAEMHGLLTGMICGGLKPQSNDWMPMLYDYTNDGIGWPVQSQTIAANVLTESINRLNAAEIDFSLLLPTPENDLIARANALIDWINAFIAGIGLIGIQTSQLSEEDHDILKELSEIALMHIDEDDDFSELESLFEQVIEHVLDCVLTLNLNLNPNCTAGSQQAHSPKPTIH